MASLANVFTDMYISGNCTVKGTIASLGGSITSQWTTVGSGIYYTAGNVGIGLTNPSSILNVNVTGSAANLYSTTTGTNSSLQFVNTADSRRAFVGMDGTGLFALSTGALALGTDNTPIIFAPSYSGGEKMRILTTGYVGIGTTNPGSLLTVSGGGSFGSGYQAFTAPTGGLIVQGNVGIGTSNPGTNALQVSGTIATSGFTSNATNTIFNFDTLTVPFVSATQVGVGTTNPQYPLDTVGDINCSGSYRQAGILQPKLTVYGSFSASTSFDTVGFDLVNFNTVEIRAEIYSSATGGAVQIQALDTSGTVYTAGEQGYVVWQGNRSTAYSYGGTATIVPNTETTVVGPAMALIKICGVSMTGQSGSQRYRVWWCVSSCWAGVGECTDTGQAWFYSSVTINRIRFNAVTTGNMTGKYSLTHYV